MDVTIERLKAFPELARALLTENLELLNRLPTPFASFLLREVIHYDWKFPMERQEIASNFVFLQGLPAPDFDELMRPFRNIKLPAALTGDEWVVDPIAYSEKLSAHLWATHQIDAFRSAAVVYMDRKTAALPPEAPSSPRLIFVMIGEGAKDPRRPLFNKLRSQGTHFSNLDGQGALPALLQAVAQRAKSLPAPFAHWYIDGGQPAPAGPGVTMLSYGGLAAARATLQRELKSSYERRAGSEAMRSQLAQKKPEDLGLRGKGDGAVLDRFAMSTLTEGSGTQIYSTTFVQWAAREALRRAQPLTMLVRFRPRQRERPMQELLLEAQRTPDLDPEGSLVDGEMGAYYTWINAQRLPGAERSSFLGIFEGGKQAIAIGPAVEKGATINGSVNVKDLIARAVA
jgi:hypothetical protein